MSSPNSVGAALPPRVWLSMDAPRQMTRPEWEQRASQLASALGFAGRNQVILKWVLPRFSRNKTVFFRGSDAKGNVLFDAEAVDSAKQAWTASNSDPIEARGCYQLLGPDHSLRGLLMESRWMDVRTRRYAKRFSLGAPDGTLLLSLSFDGGCTPAGKISEEWIKQWLRQNQTLFPWGEPVTRWSYLGSSFAGPDSIALVRADGLRLANLTWWKQVITITSAGNWDVSWAALHCLAFFPFAILLQAQMPSPLTFVPY